MAEGMVDRFVSMSRSEDIYKEIVSGRGVQIESFNHLSYITSLYSSPQGTPTVRIIQECFEPFNVAMGLQSHSPLKRNFDRVVSWVSESGLVRHWFQETLLRARKHKREEDAARREEGGEEGEEAAMDAGGSRTVSLTVEHVQGVFVILGLGCGASFLAFMTELFLVEAAK